MLYDVIIIGGGFAGLAAALPLVRARRQVLLIDAGQPRNRFAAHSHGFLGQDGVPPAEIRARGLAELSAYPTFTLREALVDAVTGALDDFCATLADGSRHRGRRLILAMGVRDELPPVPGLRERWGTGALHCPYCHGYEVAGQPLGVLATMPGADMKALLVADWGPVTLFTQDAFLPEPETAHKLAARGVVVEASPIVELLGAAPALSAVRLADGRVLPLAALFVGSRTHPASPIALDLGCAMEEGFSGSHLRVDTWKATSVPGVFAAGDASMPMHGAALSVASGALAAVGAHRSLLGF
ncbi:NAD(P)/FAD-dependent oxidoreductase [Niveispirillum sp.]|uniref:NAD(P)/FAD-dependent oxidoreductase n=1 Tax=Niveispirillum sp. TaxID=1917217 RepID=UPI001B620112|nr:NAD(P)/FAD-dependent oxidoreductase [Niveispirillum sp.]MBP7338179.1 NAD(P)/FAD-dependent oxidoreductase [Niveispirillum sp.]